MSKMKEYQMKQQEDWFKGVTFDDLIDIDTIIDPKFKAIIITTIDGEHHRATQEEITEINGLNIKYQKYINNKAIINSEQVKNIIEVHIIPFDKISSVVYQMEE